MHVIVFAIDFKLQNLIVLLTSVVNTVIESRDIEFFKNRFSVILFNNDKIIELDRLLKNSCESGEPFEPRRSKRIKIKKSFGLNFVVYFLQSTRNSSCNKVMIAHNIKTNPLTYNEDMKSQDVVFLKKLLMMKWI